MEREETKEKYPWLEPVAERRNMSDREILDKYVDSDKSCLIDSEKNKLLTYYINIKMHLV